MAKFGKFVVGCAVVGAAAASVYHYLEQNSKSSVCDVDEQDDDFAEETEETAGEEDAFTQAASRTYTTLKTGADEAMAKVKEAIGPKGESVLNVVGETAGKVKDVVVDSTIRIKDIVQEKPEDEDPENAVPEDDTFADEAEEETAEVAEEVEACADAAAEVAEAAQTAEETVEDTAEEVADFADVSNAFAQKADKVEKFFDEE